MHRGAVEPFALMITSHPAPRVRSTTRRRFLHQSAVALAATVAPCRSFALGSPSGAPWSICCLNRPWVKWSLDEMLDGVKAAGFRTLGLQTVSKANPFIAPEATRAHLETLKATIAARGLTAAVRLQVDRARELGLRALINTGTSRPEHYETWYRLMAFAAAYGADHGVQIVTKPHGGVVNLGADLLKCLEKVNHANFGLWYDPGNILYYSGRDALAELEPIAAHVSAFVAKDCAGRSGENFIQFGEGKVDFAGILRRLKRAGFTGPIWMETCRLGETAAATTPFARANREFLERTLKAL
jgi:sugar phosphate isomerase/epimerase